MAATVSIRVFTGASAANMSTTVTGIDLMSADGATNSPANRQANPITAGDYSYDKWLKARIDVAPDNYCENFEAWGDGAVDSNTTLDVGKTDTGVTPTNSASTVATNAFTNYTSTSKFAWHSTQITGVGSLTDYLVFQLQTGAGASAGDWTQETINYSYDEA